MNAEHKNQSIVRSLRGGLLFLTKLGLAAVLTAQIAGLFGRRHFLLDLANHPQVQYLLASIAALLLLAASRRWCWALVACICIGWSGWRVVPWSFGPQTAIATTRFRLLIANVLSGNRNIDALRVLLDREKPDVIVIIEADGWWLENLAELRKSHPHGLGLPREDNFGVAVFSRLPMSDVQHVMFVADGVPSIVGDVQIGPTSATLVATHPLPPIPNSYFQSRNAQLAAVAEFAVGRSGPLIVAGDLNCTMWSPNYRRLIQRTDLNNARQGFGVLPSWPTTFPSLMRIPIDHCLHSDGLRVLDCRLGEPIGSDHLPLIVDFTIPNSE
jgi:endonuclease/exonuclease/phosphatase (EEP) superfamily protein YafD